MLFKYKGIDALGNEVSSKIEAASIAEVKSKLKSKKIIYTSIDESSSAKLSDYFKLSSKIKVSELSNISRDLSIYLKSGVSLLNSLKLISNQYKTNRKFAPFFETVITLVDEGKSFYQALEDQKSIKLPEFFKQSIKISENGGMLDIVLLELSIYLKEQDRINKQITSALAYPAFIFLVSVLMVGFMLSFIVPKVTAIFEQYDQKLPTITTIVIDTGEFFSNHYQMVLFAFALILLVSIYLYKTSLRFRYGVDLFKLKIPFFKKIIEFSELSRFSYINAILLRSGIPMVQSVKLGSDILKNEVLKKLFLDASLKVVEGEKLSNILQNNKIYKIDTAFIQAVAIGEETSEVSSILQNLSELYNESNKDKISIFLSLLEPIVMLLVGSIVGFIVLAMLLPIFSLSFG